MDLSQLATDLEAIANAETDDFAELMKVSGLDPKSDLRYYDLFESKLGEADVEGWDFTGANLDRADLSQVKNIKKAVFNEETTFVGTLLPDGVLPSDLIS